MICKYTAVLLLTIYFKAVFTEEVKEYCLSFPPLENGHYQVIEEGKKIKVICDTSYEFMHKKYPTKTDGIIKCDRRKKNWDDPNPTCLLMMDHCKPPEPIENGFIIGDPPYEDGSTVYYRCNPTHYLKGSDELLCYGYTQQWSEFAPTCKEYNASSLPELAVQMKTEFVDKLSRYIPGGVENVGLDLFLLFDKSSSIMPDQFDEGIAFAKFFLQRFNISNGDLSKRGGTRLAIYTFGDEMKKEIDLTDTTIQSTKIATDKLSTIKCKDRCDGGTNMASAFKAVEYLITSNKLRPQAKKALFITSDGAPTYDPNSQTKSVEYYARVLKDNDVEIYAVGIGQDIDQKLLREIATKPPEEHVFLLKEFDDFGKISHAIEHAPPIPPSPPADKCGYISEKHQQGQKNGNFKAGRWPWMAAIITQDSQTMQSRFECSAIIICDQWVLSTAQCVWNKNPEDVYIILGVDNLVMSNGNEQYFYASQITPFDEFFQRKTVIKHDIALIKLNEPMTFNDYVRPACVQKQASDETSKPGEPAVLIGWLAPKEEYARLKDVPYSILEPSQANMTISGITFCESNKPIQYDCQSKTIFHAGAELGPSKECDNIDHGSALIMKDRDKRYNIVGLASYVAGCNLMSKSAMLFRVSEYRDWIQEITEFCIADHL